MPAHPKAYAGLAERLAATADPVTRDALLDAWLNYRDRATEWDASQWGFDPDRWQERERAQLAARDAFVVWLVPLDDAL